MSEIYLVFVVFLFVLAVFDLMVGVSNDAVNFLNSAIGAKVAKFRTIIIVAAVGVFMGATMSNGMMEVARNGVFHPAMFSLKELMFIFLAVMISDSHPSLFYDFPFNGRYHSVSATDSEHSYLGKGHKKQ